jgi:hypothetical protein
MKVIDDLDFDRFDAPVYNDPICHYCQQVLHPDNNAMVRCLDGKEPAAKGFGWISVIVEPFKEVPCCDICFDKPETKYLMV